MFSIVFSQKHETEAVGEFQDKSKEMSTHVHTMVSQHTERDDKENINASYLNENTQHLETETSAKALKTPTKPFNFYDQSATSSVVFANLKNAQDAELEAALECARSARQTNNSQMQVLTTKRALTDTSPTARASASEHRF